MPSRSPLSRSRRWPGPAAGAAVMATGIVSSCVSLDGHETTSRILLAIAASMWLCLGLVLMLRAVTELQRLRHEGSSPIGLTATAATAVLGARVLMLGWSVPATVLLALACALWLILAPASLRRRSVPATGASFMLTVSCESLAVLAATLAAHQHERWLLAAALAPFVLGLALYVPVLARLDFRQLAVGRGDHWVTGGALAIATLAAAELALAGRALHALTGAEDVLEAAALVLWVLAVAWLPFLVVMETARPRLGYDVRRWSSVFPLGMYATCSFAAGSATHRSGLPDFARAWVWVAVAVWVVQFAAVCRRGVRLGLGARPGDRPGGRA